MRATKTYRRGLLAAGICLSTFSVAAGNDAVCGIKAVASVLRYHQVDQNVTVAQLVDELGNEYDPASGCSFDAIEQLLASRGLHVQVYYSNNVDSVVSPVPLIVHCTFMGGPHFAAAILSNQEQVLLEERRIRCDEILDKATGYFMAVAKNRSALNSLYEDASLTGEARTALALLSTALSVCYLATYMKRN